MQNYTTASDFSFFIGSVEGENMHWAQQHNVTSCKLKREKAYTDEVTSSDEDDVDQWKGKVIQVKQDFFLQKQEINAFHIHSQTVHKLRTNSELKTEVASLFTLVIVYNC